MNAYENKCVVAGLAYNIVLEPHVPIGWTGQDNEYIQLISLEIGLLGNITNANIEAYGRLRNIREIFAKQPDLLPLLMVLFQNEDNSDKEDSDGPPSLRLQADVGLNGNAMPIENVKPILRKAINLLLNKKFLSDEQASILYGYVDQAGTTHLHPASMPASSDIKGLHL